ncbi:hypothetical protein ACFL27_27625 [candidate division CSSED10-310 bacterium]|uniref:Ig-like domain-containing protein n=1 Tax=candidate division CSSED10-310 bacterium TaxID=2855610 RepID=A0ABV6Z6A5_UNCC1
MTAISKKASFFLIIFMLSSSCFYSCLEDGGGESGHTAQIVCQIGLTKSMIESYAIIQIRLTVKQGDTTIWGPRTYDISAGGATLTEVEPGNGYTMLAEALSSDGTMVCSGVSNSFNAVADQTTDIGYVHLRCVGLDCTFMPGSVDPTYTFDWAISNSRPYAVQLQNLSIDLYSLNGAEIGTIDRTDRLNDYFGTTTIPANGSLTCEGWFWSNSNNSGTGWRMVWTYTGVDEWGYTVDCTCEVTCNNSP